MLRAAFILLLALPASAGAGLALEPQGAQEYVAKVTLLDKITACVDWPVATPERPFILGVLGRSPFGDQLDDYFTRRTLKGRAVHIRYFRGMEDLAECDLLFICASEKGRLGAVLSRVKSRPVLTVGDTAGFAQAGVMVNIVREESRLGFEVNLATTRESSLRMASGFLAIAQIISGPGPR